MGYYPRFHSIIYSKHRNTLYSVGGVNVKNNHTDYDIIFSFNLSTQKSQTISLNTAIGSNTKLLLTENDNYIHIIGGLTENNNQQKKMHIELDLNTNKSRVIHDFTETNPNLSEHGVLFNKTTNKIYMFGGINLYDAQGFNIYAGIHVYDDFWICDAKITNYTATKIISVWFDIDIRRDYRYYMFI